MSRELRRKAAKAAKGKGSPRKVRGRMLPKHLTLAELAPILAAFANLSGSIMSGSVTNDELGAYLSHIHIVRRVLELQGKEIPAVLDRAVETIRSVRSYEGVDEDDVIELDKAESVATSVILETPDTLIKQAAESLELRTYLNEESLYVV